MQDDYEGPLEQRRTIIYTLAFTMNVNFYGDLTDADIIREVQANVGLIVDSDGSDAYNNVTAIAVTPNPSDAEPEDDFGFTTTITDAS